VHREIVRDGIFLENGNEMPVLSQIWEITGVFPITWDISGKSKRKKVKSQKWDVLRINNL